MMIYNSDIKNTLIIIALSSVCVISLGIKLNVNAVVILVVYLIEILCLIFEIRKKKHIIWLKNNGILINLTADDVICNTKVVANRLGFLNMHVTIQTKKSYSNVFLKGFIAIPYTSYPLFLEALIEGGIKVKVDPDNAVNYYMCLEDVAALRWIPNSCKIIPENKYKVIFWMMINVIIILLSCFFLKM